MNSKYILPRFREEPEVLALYSEDAALRERAALMVVQGRVDVGYCSGHNSVPEFNWSKPVFQNSQLPTRFPIRAHFVHFIDESKLNGVFKRKYKTRKKLPVDPNLPHRLDEQVKEWRKGLREQKRNNEVYKT